jgi:hypothetical protein
MVLPLVLDFHLILHPYESLAHYFV